MTTTIRIPVSTEDINTAKEIKKKTGLQLSAVYEKAFKIGIDKLKRLS